MADNARSFCQPDQTILLLLCLVKIRESLKSKLCCLLSSGAGRGRYRLFTFLLRSNVVTPLSLPMHQISNQRKIICPPGMVDTRQHRPLPPDIPRLPVLRQTAFQMRQHLYKWLCHSIHHNFSNPGITLNLGLESYQILEACQILESNQILESYLALISTSIDQFDLVLYQGRNVSLVLPISCENYGDKNKKKTENHAPCVSYCVLRTVRIININNTTSWW